MASAALFVSQNIGSVDTYFVCLESRSGMTLTQATGGDCDEVL